VKDLNALGQYITELILKDQRIAGNCNEAARLAGVSAAELFSLRHNKRQKPNPNIMFKLSQTLSGDYERMLTLAGYLKEINKESVT